MNASPNSLTRGTRVATLKTVNVIPPNFPGWDAPDAAAHLVDIPVGTVGQIIDVESHGSNPWTRYTVRFPQGLRSGCCIGTGIKVVR